MRSGHPWVYREGGMQAELGEVVALQDPAGEAIGWGVFDEGPIAVRVLGRDAPPADVPAAISERITRADAFRWRLAPVATNCWRVVAGAGDGLPGLVVDRYDDLAVLRVYASAWEPHLDTIVAAVRDLGWATTILRRLGVRRVDGREGSDLLFGPAAADAKVVEEHGMRLLVRPLVGQKTGLFLDQREHRALVGRWSMGRRVANLFAYNGGFSVAAALGGAAIVTTVDLAPDAIEDARENFRLNGLDPGAHRFEVADVFKWKGQGTYDLLVCDPPSLTRGKRSDANAGRAYRSLHERLAPMIARDGLLATASCTARLSLADWQAAVRDGLAPHADWSWLWVSGEPPDHPVALAHDEGHYLKFSLLRRR